jgi:hypothetical protein
MNYSVTNADKFYPQANNWMWNYCFFLGKFTDSEGVNYDLGIHIADECAEYSLAVVFSDEAGDYSSGSLAPHADERFNPEYKLETYRRARMLGIVPELPLRQ